jgi:hypothetical protein
MLHRLSTLLAFRGAGGLPKRRERTLDDKKQQADRYRRRAEQIRRTAETMTHQESRIALLRLADSYDRLALRIEYERTPTE